MLMKRICFFLLMSLISVSLFGIIPQNDKGQNYINSSKSALDRKNYDESMQWAQRYINEYHSYDALANIAEQMYKEALRIYPNDKKAFVKPLEYAARLGNVDAIFIYGVHCYKGDYISKDIDKGMALIKTAEKMGHPKARNTYLAIANGYDYLVHKAKQQKYNDMIIGAVGLGALVAVAAKIISGGTSSSSSYSSSYGSSSYNSSSSSSGSSSSSSSSGNSSRATSVDVETIGMPKYSWHTNWYKESILPLSEPCENTTGENQARKIKFEGVGIGKLSRVIGSRYYWASTGKKYKTLDDAIIAEYVYLKYGKVRQKGRP